MKKWVMKGNEIYLVSKRLKSISPPSILNGSSSFTVESGEAELDDVITILRFPIPKEEEEVKKFVGDSSNSNENGSAEDVELDTRI